MAAAAPLPALAGALTAAAALAAAPGPARAGVEEVERFTGTARGADGEVWYVEEHAVTRAGGRLLSAVTRYRDARGAPLATLRTDFSADPFAPSYVFEDHRRGVSEEVVAGQREVTLRAGERSRTLALGPAERRRLVTGQGLDRLVRARLDALARGERPRLSYAIPSRQDTYDLRVEADGARRGGEVLKVRVEFSSWLLRLLAPALHVEYERATGRLLRYRGPSNLSDPAGENPPVDIVYRYPEPAADAAPRRTDDPP